MEFLFKPPALIILKYLSRNNNKAIKGNLKSSLASRIRQIDSVLDTMVVSGDITIAEAIVSLTDKSIKYIKNYDNVGSEYIFKNNIDLAIIKFLYEIDIPISTKWFPKIIQDWSPTYTMSSPDEGYDLDTYIVFHSGIKSYVINQDNNFSLKPTGKSYYESILALEQKIANKDNLEIKNEELQSQINELTLESLQYHKENRDLVEKLQDSQTKINQLSKHPTSSKTHLLNVPTNPKT